MNLIRFTQYDDNTVYIKPEEVSTLQQANGIVGKVCYIILKSGKSYTVNDPIDIVALKLQGKEVGPFVTQRPKI